MSLFGAKEGAISLRLPVRDGADVSIGFCTAPNADSLPVALPVRLAASNSDV